MKVKNNHQEGIYIIVLNEEEAFEFSQFISNNCRSLRPDGNPALETQIHNEMYELGLKRLYDKKWDEMYDLSR